MKNSKIIKPLWYIFILGMPSSPPIKLELLVRPNGLTSIQPHKCSKTPTCIVSQSHRKYKRINTAVLRHNPAKAEFDRVCDA